MAEVSWARGRALTTADNSAGDRIFETLVEVTDQAVSAEIAHLKKGFDVREGLLNDIINSSRYNSIETFLQQEFARQRVELGAEIFTAVIGETSVSNVYTALSDTRRQQVLNESYRKALKSYETYMRRMRVIRSAFLRTFDFFRATTESTLTKLQEKHAREIMLSKATNSMTLQNVNDYGKGPETATAQHLRASQMRERHALEISNIREFNDKTSAREIALLEFHLNSTESILAADIHLLQRLIEQKLDDEGMLAQMLTNEKVAAADEVRRERHGNAERLRATQASMKKETQVIMDSDRRADRDERKRDFAQQGISIVDNALYQLTFSTRDVDQPVDSVLDSDDSDDSGDEDDAAVEVLMNVPTGVTSLQKQMKRESLARRRERRRRFEIRVHETKKNCKDVMHKLTAELKGGISQLYAVHEQQLKDQTGKWSELREGLRANHIAATEDLEEKHTMDRHVLLEADRKQHRSQVQQSDVKAQSAMADHVFAEVRNVLSAMMSIADGLKGSTEEELEQFAERQKTICRYAVDTMTHMLEITKHADGEHESKTESIRLSDLVTRVTDIQKDRCCSGVLLSSATSDVRVLMDRQLVTQLLVDMLSNSLKFTSEGHIVVVAKEIERDEQANAITIEMGIADTGDGGIDLNESIELSKRRDSGHDYLLRNASYGLYLIKLIAATLKAPLQLLTPLPPGHEYRKTEKGGAGSYLYARVVCKLPPSAHVTDITSDIPLYTATAMEPSKSWELSPSGRIRVLIADDQRLVRISLIQVLCKLVEHFPACSMCIKTVRSAEEACRAMHAETFDLVFLDQNFDATSVGADKGGDSGCNLEAASNMQSTVKDFLKREKFNEVPGDGVQAGTDVLDEFHEYGGIMIMATGSVIANLHSEVCMLKPFSVADIIESFETAVVRETSSLMKRLEKRDDKLFIRSTNVVLFSRVSESGKK